MKLKYKKLIVLVSIGTVFLSIIILSMVPTGGNPNNTPEEMEFVKIEDTKILDVIHAYYNAKATLNFEVAEELVSDPTQIPKEYWQKLTSSGVEQYSNFVCYGIKNEEQSSYCIYVQFDIKLKGIETLSPSMGRFYVKLGSDDKYLIYLNALDEEEEEFFQESNKNPEVDRLIDDTNSRFEKAKESDPKLKELWEKQAAAIKATEVTKSPPQAPAASQGAIVPSSAPPVPAASVSAAPEKPVAPAKQQ